MRWLATILLGAIALVAPAWATYDEAPWHATVVKTYSVHGSSYTDTLHIWMDRGYRDRVDGPIHSWDETQRTARLICAICTPRRIWPGEEDRYQQAKAEQDRPANKEPSYERLSQISFLPISITIKGPLPVTGIPMWRNDTTDVVIVTMKDSRRYVSVPGIETGTDPAANMRVASTMLPTCWQFKAMLGWRYLLTPEKLRLLWDRPLYVDHPTENTFLVPVVRGTDSFELKQIIGIKLFIMGEWVDLQPPATGALVR
jgi:hypothetical protein